MKKAYINWSRQLKKRPWGVQQQHHCRICRISLLYASSEFYQWQKGMLYLCKMRMNLALKSLRVSSSKKLLFTLERASMSWKAEFICIKMLSFWKVSRRISSGSAEQINFWIWKSIKLWKRCRFSAKTTAKSCLDHDFVSLFKMILTAQRIELSIPWLNMKELISKRGRRLSLSLPI